MRWMAGGGGRIEGGGPRWRMEKDGEEETGEKGIKLGKKHNNTIMKYKRWDTYYSDYSSFPYI